MELKPDDMFALVEVAYRKGVVDKLTPLAGEALDRLMQRTGYNMENLMNALNDARDESVLKLDKALALSSPLLRLAANDHLMGLVARLMDLQVVKTTAIRGMDWYFGRTLAKSEGTLPPLGEQLKAIPVKLMSSLPLLAGKRA